MTLADVRWGTGRREQILQAGRRALRRSCHSYAVRQADYWREDGWFGQASALLESHLESLLSVALRCRSDPDRAEGELIDLICARCDFRSEDGSCAARELDCCALYSVLAPLVRAMAEVLGHVPPAPRRPPPRLVDRRTRR